MKINFRIEVYGLTSRRIMYYLRAFKILALGYWRSEQKWKAYGILAVVLILNLASVFLTVLVNDWYKEFWDVLQAYEFDSFWFLVGKFSLIAAIYIAIGVYSVYLQQLLQIKWREWLTDKYLVRWMENRAYYKLKLMGKDMDNPDQRISEDINQFVALTLSLTIGLVRQLITLVAFTVILWNLSGIITVPIGSYECTIYGYMVWLSLVYSIVGTYLTHKVGKALINLNYEQQKYEADFRFAMMRVRENTESIAFYRGEKPELENFLTRFKIVIGNFRDIMTRQKILNGFTAGYGQLAIIIPLLLAAPRWFAKEVQVGWIMQVSNAFGQVQGAMSYFVDAYTTIAQWCSVVRRLDGFNRHIGKHQHYIFLPLGQFQGQFDRSYGFPAPRAAPHSKHLFLLIRHRYSQPPVPLRVHCRPHYHRCCRPHCYHRIPHPVRHPELRYLPPAPQRTDPELPGTFRRSHGFHGTQTPGADCWIPPNAQGVVPVQYLPAG